MVDVPDCFVFNHLSSGVSGIGLHIVAPSTISIEFHANHPSSKKSSLSSTCQVTWCIHVSSGVQIKMLSFVLGAVSIGSQVISLPLLYGVGWLAVRIELIQAVVVRFHAHNLE